jgi:hypothetical protein
MKTEEFGNSFESKFDCCRKIKNVLLGTKDYIILKAHVTCHKYIENISTFLPQACSIDAK